jgi:tetratricopeptide (TPR) repeat protein
MGDTTKALRFAEESVALYKKTGDLAHIVWALDVSGYIHQILGEWDKSEQYYTEAFSISQKIEDFQSTASANGYMGIFHFDKGEYTKAKEYYAKMLEACEKAQAKYIQMSISHFIIVTYLELGEIEEAANLIDELQEYAAELNDRLLITRADTLRAMQLRAQKKWKESIEYFDKGLREWEAIGARQWQVYDFARMFLMEYARLYLERNQEGDREKAYNLLNQALGIFQKLDAKKDIEKIIAKKKLLTA